MRTVEGMTLEVSREDGKVWVKGAGGTGWRQIGQLTREGRGWKAGTQNLWAWRRTSESGPVYVEFAQVQEYREQTAATQRQALAWLVREATATGPHS